MFSWKTKIILSFPLKSFCAATLIFLDSQATISREFPSISYSEFIPPRVFD